MTLEKYLEDLGDEDKPLRHSGLLQLSGMPSKEVGEFKIAWVALSPSRKCEILGRLAELCEDNLELDFTAVFSACLKDENEEVRERATRGLWECDDRVIIRPLTALLEDDPSPNVRAVAASSLGKFAELAQEGKVLARDGERVREALVSAISKKDEELEVRRRAIEAVASFNSSEVEEMIQEAYRDSHPKLKQSAIYAMGRSSDIQWLPIVLKEMRDEEPAIRYEAATACGQLGDESTVPHLISLIEDEDALVQVSAVQALGSIGGPLAKQALKQCLKLGDEALEEAAQVALDNVELEQDPLAFRIQT